MDIKDDLQPLILDKKRLDVCISNIPNQPGCYLMLDNDERILYVGKSKHLIKRVKSYFNRLNDHTPRILLMVKQIYDIQFIVTDNETEALTLESNLIKSNKPYFNVLLKDDKKYPYVCITWSEIYPRIYITRKRRNRNIGDKYYGPFVDVTLLRNTLALIKNIFPLRQRPLPMYKDRTCLNYSIKRCPGVCQGKIMPEEYNLTLKKVEMILQGRSTELEQILISKMNEFSRRLEYESALLIRDQLKSIKNIGETQKMTLPDSSISRDVISIASDSENNSIQFFQMRSGKLVGRLGYISKNTNESSETILQKTIEEHYSQTDAVEIPLEILTQYEIPQEKLLSEWLSTLKGRKVKIRNPKRSNKAKIIDLVYKNARYELERIQRGREKHLTSLEDLAELLELSLVPRRIEGYDISHIQGSDPVGSQVVFIDGLPAKQHYRKYKIQSDFVSIGNSNDYESIRELIRRRFRRWSKFKADGFNIQDIVGMKASVLDSPSAGDWPDLVMIDGGKGQLSAAIDALTELNLHEDINICSLAKKREEVFIPYRKSPVNTSKDTPALLVLRRLRNEAHRFAVTFHKQQRSKRMTRSELNNIPGVGPKRIKQLLAYFKSVEAIQMAKIKDLNSVPGLGDSVACSIWDYFNKE
ncbi:excinuclease ABC subunit UvrC [Prochlorococcus sp. MIT 1223]|uniref:excinuclease ABC subunit UvrC n=1 Tax=Prochlorococcus sp. MIT 1223 TaxID=3096217 RepID=UPI002A7568FC|nr:excinuclease ABC subunit UvrC [Prochlorococcus sp. MIT 1223]